MLGRYALWSVWIILATVSVMRFPQGAHGLLGGLAAVIPLVLLIKPRLYRRHALLIGLLAISVVALFSGGAGGVFALLFSIAVLSVGVGLAPGVSERRSLVNGAPVKYVENKEACLGLLASEVGRARRHERPLRVVALAYQDSSERMTNESQLSLLKQAVQDEIHVYCPVYQFETHVVAIVPELQDKDLVALVSRLQAAVILQSLSPINVGSAAFPEDAVTSVGLLDKALENCSSSGVGRNNVHNLTVVGGSGLKAEMPSP